MNLDALQAHEFEPIVVSYNDRDVMLYALSLGVCDDPLDADELKFVYEKDLRVLPSFTAPLAHPPAWIAQKKFEVDFTKLLHGEQRAAYLKPFPNAGEIRGEYRVRAVVDKGEGKGALVFFDKKLINHTTDDHLCTISSTLFLRGDGGCGEFGDAPGDLPAVPSREPDFVEERVISQRAALLYRLNGDRNPIHADPEVAGKAGFDAPILHGLCTYGVCGFGILKAALEYDVSRLKSLDMRFSAPVLPGETLRLEGWEVEGGIAFQAKAKERDRLVASNGIVATA